MEGIGSRSGRPSSRYGTAPVFTGPVRRWQKQWVHVSSSSSSISYNHSNNYNSNGGNNNNVVRLRRWTPVPAAQAGGDSETMAEERPRRKLRYTPIVTLEGKKKEAEKGGPEVKPSKTNQYIMQGAFENDYNEKRSLDNVFAAEAQALATKDLNNDPMDLEGDEEDHDLGGADKVADWVKAARKGFAC